MRAQLLFIIVLIFICLSSALTPFKIRTQRYKDVVDEVLKAMNKSVNPCDDFYLYSCGNWIATHPVPPDESRIEKSFEEVENFNDAVLELIFADPNLDPKLRVYYSSCMNEDAIERLGVDPVVPIFTMIDDIRDTGDLMRVVAILHAFGVDALFSFGVTVDAKNPKLNIADFGQGGLALPDVSLYWTASDIRDRYKKHIANMFVLLGESHDVAMRHAQETFTFEQTIANFTLPPDDLIDPFQLYNPMTYSQFKNLTPSLPWDAYFGLPGKFPSTNVTVDVPTFFRNLSKVISSTTPKIWTSYLKWQVIHSFASLLPKRFVDEDFNFFKKILRGLKELPPRNKTCIAATDRALGELLGQYYVAKTFPPQSKQKAHDILLTIEDAMNRDLLNLTWMDNQTRTVALEKLKLVYNMIGSPENPRNYSHLTLLENQYFHNTIVARVSEWHRLIQKMDGPADRNEWDMTAATVNAYYDPSRNEMVFPAAILQYPFFNLSLPTAMNYGAIGAVMGHELTHGFDNQGKDYDGYGILRNWWQPQTEKQFNERAQCVVKLYSSFEVLPGVYVDGVLTQGENIADMGGVKNSFSAFAQIMGNHLNDKSVVPGLTNAQLFFVAYAQVWCSNATPEYLKVQVKTDPHSPAKFRVIGPLMNLPAFAQTFDCPVGSVMNPTSRCVVW
jgi:putative endopeptidase